MIYLLPQLIEQLLITVLTACNDSDDKKTVVVPIIPAEPAAVSISGTVINNRLSNVAVCSDCNSNMICDADEIKAVTDIEGRFTLENVSAKDAEICPFTAEITTQSRDETLDELVAEPYVLTSPAGCEIVSPMTSMVQSQIALGDSKEEAIEKVQRKMMTDISPCSDDVIAIIEDEELSEAEKKEAIYVYQSGLVYTQMMIQNMENMSDMMGDDMEYAQGMAVVHNYQLNGDGMRMLASELAEVSRLIEDEADADANEDAAPQESPQHISAGLIDFYRQWEESFSGTQLEMLFTQLREDAENSFVMVEQGFLMANKSLAQPLDFNEQFLNRNSRLNGFTLFEDTDTTEAFDLTYSSERIEHTGDTSADAKSRLVAQQMSWQTDNFNRVDGHLLGDMLVLVNDEWQRLGTKYEFSRAHVTPYANREQIELTNIEVPEFSYNLEGKQYPVANRSIASLFLMHSDIEVWHQLFDVVKTFPENSQAFDLVLRSSGNTYILGETKDCSSDFEINEVCNAVKALVPSGDHFNINSGKWHFEMSREHSFEDLDSMTPVASGVPVMPIVHSDANGHIVARFHDNGEVAFVQFPLNLNQEFYRHRTDLDYNSESDVRNPKVLATGNWRVRTRSQDLIEIDIPNSIIRMNPELSENMFFTTVEDVVRFGKIHEAGDVLSEGQLRVNTPASNGILDQLDYDKLYDVIAAREL